jgi:hypothetical protein
VEPQFTLSWTEQGGPAVIEPVRNGFGSLMIARALAAEFAADVRLLYRPEGFACFVVAPLAALLADDEGQEENEGKDEPDEIVISSRTAEAKDDGVEAAA